MNASALATGQALRSVAVAKRLGAEFLLVHAWLPAAAGVAILALFSLTSLDTTIANRVFYIDGHWIGAHTAWAEDMLHTGGRNLMRAFTAAAMLVWASGRFRPSPRPAAAVAGYVALSVILTVALTGLLKSITNVDCPWDLAGFGGTRPYVHLFGDRPDVLPHARCFPGAHSSSGFALLCLYFAFRERLPRLAAAGLWSGLWVGALFSFGQQARGAHFLSHDLTSAFLAWFVALGVYLAWKRPATAPARRTYRRPRSRPAPGRL